MKYGLIGEKLGHSFSKQIHESLASYTYELKEIQHEELSALFKEGFEAINVTIPYKQAVIPYLDEIDDKAKQIGAVNTIVNRNGKYCGYNTDYAGFAYILKQHQFNVKDKRILVLGSGGTSKTVKTVLLDLLAKEVIVVSRNKTLDTIAYEDLPKYYDVDYIVNTTPVGMYPNVINSVLDISPFYNLSGVIDVVYNPLFTTLLLQAKERKIPCANGLSMLVAQAKYACELFTNQPIEESKIKEIYHSLLIDLVNIVLVGMPSSGKTTLGQELAILFNKHYVDSDEVLIQKESCSIPEIFQEKGEPYFRKVETKIIQELAKEKRQIIATGGGVILKKENMDALHQNGVVVFIDRDINLLSSDESRPLSKTKEMIVKMYEERYSRYQEVSDVQIVNNGTIGEGIQAIMEVIYEAICDKWA